MKFGKGIFISGVCAALVFSFCFTAFGEANAAKDNEMYMRYITEEDTELFHCLMKKLSLMPISFLQLLIPITIMRFI